MGAQRLEEPQGPPDHPMRLCSPGHEGSQPKGEWPETAQKEGQVFKWGPRGAERKENHITAESDVTIETFKCHTLMTLATKAGKAMAKIPTHSTRTISIRFCSQSSWELTVEAVSCPRIPPALQFPGLDHMPHMELHFLHL